VAARVAGPKDGDLKVGDNVTNRLDGK